MFIRLSGAALCAALLFVFPSSGSTEQLSYTDSIPLSVTNWSDSLTIPKFDPALGTLISVEIDFNAGVVGNLRFESLDAAPAVITEELSAELHLMKPDLSIVLQVSPSFSETTAVTAYDGVLDFGGTSGATHMNVSANASSFKGPYSEDNAFFTGVGTISFPVNAEARSRIVGAGNLVSQFNTDAFANVAVRYNYDSMPVCSAIPDGISYQNLACTGPTTVVQLDGSGSGDNTMEGLSFTWSSNCPNAQFDDPNSVTPLLTFDSVANGTSCTATLTLVDDSQQTSVCQAAISVKGCNFDCRGVLDGPATVDACGVCEGNNECFQCDDQATLTSSFALDNAALGLFKTLKKAVKLHSKVTGERHYGQDLVVTGSELYGNSWATAWSLPEFITTCDNLELCQTVNNQAYDQQFLSSSNGLKTLIFQALKGIAKHATVEQKAKIKKLKKRAKKLAKQNEQTLESIPDQSQCVS